MSRVFVGMILAGALLAVGCVCDAGASRTDKTLVAWVTLDDLAQQGGRALTIQSGDRFDAIVFGEKARRRWMAGSNFFCRTEDDRDGSPPSACAPAGTESSTSSPTEDASCAWGAARQRRPDARRQRGPRRRAGPGVFVRLETSRSFVYAFGRTGAEEFRR
jgi:hypothetical protein